MKSVSKLCCLVLLVCGVTVEARGQPHPVACLQYPVCEAGGGDYWFFAWRYEDGDTPCVDGPYDDWAIAADGTPYPQVCPNCQSARLDAKEQKSPPCRPLKEALPINYKFADGIPQTAKTPIVNGVQNEWKPLVTMTVLHTQWVRVQTLDRAIPVKLYTVEVDLGKSGIPEDRLPKKTTRTLQVGFEMKGFPADVDEQHVRVLDPKRWKTNPSCPTACTVQIDDETQPFFVITKNDVFAPLKAHAHTHAPAPIPAKGKGK